MFISKLLENNDNIMNPNEIDDMDDEMDMVRYEYKEKLRKSIEAVLDDLDIDLEKSIWISISEGGELEFDIYPYRITPSQIMELVQRKIITPDATIQTLSGNLSISVQTQINLQGGTMRNV